MAHYEKLSHVNLHISAIEKFELLLLNRQYQACLNMLQQDMVQIQPQHIQKLALLYALEPDNHACKQNAYACLEFMKKTIESNSKIPMQTRVKNQIEVTQTVQELQGKTGHFFQAIAYGDQLRMRHIIRSEGSGIVNRPLNGQRPIEQAISHKSIAAIEILLEHGAQVTADDHERAIQYASLLYSNHVERDLCFLCPSTNTPLQRQSSALNQEIQDTLAVAERIEQHLQQQHQQTQRR